jgi:hypothetical protein
MIFFKEIKGWVKKAMAMLTKIVAVMLKFGCTGVMQAV